MSDNEPELPLGSKMELSPLDAYVSAEPNEPVFTLQGGDPLAGPLVILWARLARARCGLGYEPEATENWIEAVLRDNQVETDNEQENLLRRATSAEQIAWAMGHYRKGNLGQLLDADNEPVPVTTRLDLHDYRIYCASRLSNAFSEMNDMIEQLQQFDFDNPAILQSIHNEIVSLRELFNMVEPRPGRKLSNVNQW